MARRAGAESKTQETRMIIITRKGVTDDELDHIRERVETLGLRTHVSRGEHRTVIGCVGDDDAGAELAGTLQAVGVNTDFVVVPDWPTVLKLRVLSQG